MDRMFPLGLPAPTAFYLVLYLVTLAVHVAFMNYVLAGTAYLAAVTIFPGGPLRRDRGRVASLLRDWMPASLSAAITAGVAPLLFVQVLYHDSFYTANLLLFHRWMAVLPALIVGFYLLYLLKEKEVGAWPLVPRVLVGAGPIACFAFTGYSWTENHLLGMKQALWPAHYASGSMISAGGEILPRLSIWFTGAVPTLALLVAWQLWQVAGSASCPTSGKPRRLAEAALLGLIASIGSSGWYFAAMEPSERAVLTGALAAPYLWMAIAGLVVQIIAWGVQWRRPSFGSSGLVLASAGWLATVLGVSVLREAVRLNALDPAKLESIHARAALSGGFVVFLIFAAVNLVLITWCVLLVRRGVREAEASQ